MVDNGIDISKDRQWVYTVNQQTFHCWDAHLDLGISPAQFNFPGTKAHFSIEESHYKIEHVYNIHL